MSILRNFVEKKAQEIVQAKIEHEESEAMTAKEDVKMYNRMWLLKVANKYGYQITSNEARAVNILKKLNDRDGHCPCGGMTDEFLCPCKLMREFGHCKCGLYESAKDINPQGSTSAHVKKE